MSSPRTVIVKILEKEYQVACPPGQEAGLLDAARQLDKQMRAVRDAGKVIGLERIAVMVALNTTYELMKQEPAVAETPRYSPVSAYAPARDEGARATGFMSGRGLY